MNHYRTRLLLSGTVVAAFPVFHLDVLEGGPAKDPAKKPPKQPTKK